jgi:hypothetical protein
MMLKIHTVIPCSDKITGKVNLLQSVSVIETDCIVSVSEAIIEDEQELSLEKELTSIELSTGRMICVPYTLDEVLKIIALVEEQEEGLTEADEVIKKLINNN